MSETGLEAQPIAAELKAKIAAAAAVSGVALKPWLWQIATGTLLIAFLMAIIRPWSALGGDLNAEDVATQWSESIGKLGIEPVFPPEEDINVGDVYAIINDAESRSDARTFIGASVKLDHANVRWAFDSKETDIPTFSATVGANPGQDRGEVDVPTKYADNQISLSLAAFPGVTITHAVKASGLLGFEAGASSASREGLQIEEIHIPIAETYGIVAPDAVSALDLWCAQPRSKPMCTREFAIKMLSFVLGREVFYGRNGNGNAPSVGLLLVSRVYAAREFRVRRITAASRSGSLRAGAEPGTKSAESAGTANPQGDANAASGGAATVAGSQSARASEGILQTFQRPVVFGIRSIKKSL